MKILIIMFEGPISSNIEKRNIAPPQTPGFFLWLIGNIGI